MQVLLVYATHKRDVEELESSMAKRLALGVRRMGRLGSLEALERLEPGEWDIERIPARRDVAEALRARLELLGTEDRVLLKTYLEAGSSFDEIARLAGMNRSTVCRRIHRLIRRLYDETYVRCEGNRALFSEPELAVICDHFVRGFSLKRICRDHNLSYYRARAIVEKARRFARRTGAG